MAGLFNSMALKLTDAANGRTYTALSSPLVLELTTSAPTATTPGTPVAGGSYANQTITFAAAAGNPAAGASNIACNYSGMPACSWVGGQVKDSAGTPQYTWWALVGGGTKTINSGDSVSVASGGYTNQIG
jgi:hypothetical protein